MISKLQFERWQDFAIRMARTCFKRRRNPTAKEIEQNVRYFFDCLDPEDLKSIVDWDHCDPYPKGSKHYERKYRTECWHCHGVKKKDCPHRCEEGHIYNYAKAQCVTDALAALSENFNPYYCHDLSEARYEKREEQFCGPVQCCIRAGLDLAVAPSAGVMGFTAGDLRRMYPEGVPDWVTGGKKHRWETQEFTGVIPGVGLVPGKTKRGRTFAEMPDSAEVWI